MRTKVIVADDLTNHTVQDLLGALHVDQLPSLLFQDRAYCGAAAFEKMREITGVDCFAAGTGTGIGELASMQCEKKIFETM